MAAIDCQRCRRETAGRGFPSAVLIVQGVAWIVMILARALHYAHRMNTFHRDVKPGNVLLTLQHGPQLLDFNLAESPHSADKADLALHGGTLPYMAPEQIEAFINPDLWDKVSARADIYSLGLVLRELLTGQKPEIPVRSLPPQRALRAALDSRSFLEVDIRRINPSIPRLSKRSLRNAWHCLRKTGTLTPRRSSTTSNGFSSTSHSRMPAIRHVVSGFTTG